MNIGEFVVGGCGFIGSHYVRECAKKNPDRPIVVLDKLTEAGDVENIRDVLSRPNVHFVLGDMDRETDVRKALTILNNHMDLSKGGIKLQVVNFGARTHVDRSLVDEEMQLGQFRQDNLIAPRHFWEIMKKISDEGYWVDGIMSSTDEVYGSITSPGQSFSETDPLNPANPYSGFKAEIDQWTLDFAKTWPKSQRLMIIRPTNAFGWAQLIEKLVPRCIGRLICGLKPIVWGDGLYVRDWLYVLELIEAIMLVMEKGKRANAYNIGVNHDPEIPNIKVVQTILKLMGFDEEHFIFKGDRPDHDREYRIATRKIERLGWQPNRDWDVFVGRLQKVIDWYENNRSRWEAKLYTVERELYDKLGR